jgi:hypothetical protein
MKHSFWYTSGLIFGLIPVAAKETNHSFLLEHTQTQSSHWRTHHFCISLPELIKTIKIKNL